MVEHFSCKEDVVGSIPTPGSLKTRITATLNIFPVLRRSGLALSGPIAAYYSDGVYDILVELTEREIAILDFERRPWEVNGPKQRAIREKFGISPSRYYQIRDSLLDRVEALEYDPLLVLRLRKHRTTRRSNRYGIPQIQSPIR